MRLKDHLLFFSIYCIGSKEQAGTRWNKGFSMIFLLPWWHRCHRMEAFKGILWRYIPTKTIQKGDVSHICPPIRCFRLWHDRWSDSLLSWWGTTAKQCAWRLRWTPKNQVPFQMPSQAFTIWGTFGCNYNPSTYYEYGIKRLQFQRAYARAILTVKQTMIIMAEDDWFLKINIFLDISLPVGGFNHLEKYESQLE